MRKIQPDRKIDNKKPLNLSMQGHGNEGKQKEMKGNMLWLCLCSATTLFNYKMLILLITRR